MLSNSNKSGWDVEILNNTNEVMRIIFEDFSQQTGVSFDQGMHHIDGDDLHLSNTEFFFRNRKPVFLLYQVNITLLTEDNPDGIVKPDLPTHNGQET